MTGTVSGMATKRAKPDDEDDDTIINPTPHDGGTPIDTGGHGLPLVPDEGDDVAVEGGTKAGPGSSGRGQQELPRKRAEQERGG